jgi:membrane fusion protein (multidrug efflux system)
MNIKILGIKPILIIATVIILLSACNKSDSAGDKKSQGGKMNPKVAANYIVIRDTTLKESIVITGNIQADESVDLRTESAGKVTKIFFSEGAKVKQGELLLKINDQELKAQYDRAKARQKLAEEQEYRQRILLKKEAISQQEYDIVFTELQSLKAETELINAQLAKTELRAPFAGQLGLRMISVGDYITPTSTITKLVKNDKVKITFSIPEKYSNSMKKNAEIIFMVEGNDRKYKANVYAIEPMIDENTRTLQVRAIANNDGELIPGSFSKVELGLKEIKNAILVPNQAIIPILKGKKVYTVENGLAKEVIIETGIRNDQFIQVTSGLNVGDTVITTGIMSIKNGSKLILK